MNDVRERMIKWCLEEQENYAISGRAEAAYVAALSTAAAFCDQVAKEKTRSKHAGAAAKECGDFIWEAFKLAREQARDLERKRESV